MTLLESINSPSDVKKLSQAELVEYSKQAREYIISTVNNCGGHLASNLGTVELTIALHYVFNCPTDSILFDTGHQSYMHKIITGRREQFSKLRTDDGVSGFQSSKESDFDAYTSGHSGNSLSVGAGIARANKMLGKSGKVVSVIGDGAFTAGMAFEALNDIGSLGDDVIIVLNDNKMSISKNVGAMSKYLSKLRISRNYPTLKYIAKNALLTIPFVGDKLVKLAEKAKRFIKKAIDGDKIFENFGVKYYGPFDGHNIKNLIEIFSAIKNKKGPILVHLLTDKGKGYGYAEENPTKYHGVSPKNNLKNCENFADVLGQHLCNLAKNNDNIVAITAAMTDGTGLKGFSDKYKDRFFDVGIAEAHAVSLSAGLSRSGAIPICAVYSSFLQRAFDQILTDVCIDNLPVIFAIDHSGFVSGDGVTHQGIFDVSYLSIIPNMTIVTPINAKHLRLLIDYAVKLHAPIAIRYPKSYDAEFDSINVDCIYRGKWNFIRKDKNKTLIVVSSVSLLQTALNATNCDVAFATFIKPFDTEIFRSPDYEKIIVMEDNVKIGGLGENIIDYINSENIDVKVSVLSHGDKFIFEKEKQNMLKFSALAQECVNNLVK